ncbi:protein CsuE [Sphingobium phenoxybenzoativorans]|uniref:Protein CsuE n=1 Tax=Sphingobium phenoxybenzoativorans TaxID=1592790 RepID=A0A975K3M6_9SPHN|nr:spore coat protein U domain-containing protein [Sphingobium phenoxybenzoativorans]QUT04275.1 protein CsuE [Sphingobium phenoxybenzoativorans]
MVLTVKGFWKCLTVLLISAAALFASPALACTVSGTVTNNVGPYSPAAVKAGAVPAISNQAGLSCGTAVLVLLGGSYIRATFTSANNFLLKPSSGANISYTASADSNAAVPITQGATVDYMQNNLLNLLGLLGGSNAALPFFIKPSSATLVAAGTYSDVITINWSWRLCSGVYVANVCTLGTLDQGTGQSVITVNLTVAPQNMTMVMSTTTTWDTLNSTTNPKALPGSKRRSSVLLTNPDIVPLDSNTVSVVVPTPAGTYIALDGDGSSGGAAIQFTQGNPTSNLTFTYTSPSSTSDNVEFSSDGGSSWAYVPVAGDATSQSAVTHVRLKPQGVMAAGSSFTVSLPYAVK